MPLSSTSTDTEVQAEYDDTASWSESRSVALAKRFVVACRILIRRLENTVTKGANSLSKTVSDLRAEKEEAEAFVQAVDPTPIDNGTTRVVRADFSQMRAHG